MDFECWSYAYCSCCYPNQGWGDGSRGRAGTVSLAFFQALILWRDGGDPGSEKFPVLRDRDRDRGHHHTGIGEYSEGKSGSQHGQV